jgi:hypothetical protein
MASPIFWLLCSLSSKKEDRGNQKATMMPLSGDLLRKETS